MTLVETSGVATRGAHVPIPQKRSLHQFTLSASLSRKRRRASACLPNGRDPPLIPKPVDLDLIRPVPLRNDVLWEKVIGIEASEDFGREVREVRHRRIVPPPEYDHKRKHFRYKCSAIPKTRRRVVGIVLIHTPKRKNPGTLPCRGSEVRPYYVGSTCCIRPTDG